MGESIANMIRWLGFFDPETIDNTTILSFEPCIDMSLYDNSNDLSNPRNRDWVFWDWIDAATDTSDSYTDSINITVKDVFDAMASWSTSTSCSAGTNRDRCEHSWSNTSAFCPTGFSDDCGNGEVCVKNSGGTGVHYCYGGTDPHGANPRDWVYWISQELSLSETTLWQTMQGSTCVGAADNSYPFAGGYRSD